MRTKNTFVDTKLLSTQGTSRMNTYDKQSRPKKAKESIYRVDEVLFCFYQQDSSSHSKLHTYFLLVVTVILQRYLFEQYEQTDKISQKLVTVLCDLNAVFLLPKGPLAKIDATKF